MRPPKAHGPRFGQANSAAAVTAATARVTAALGAAGSYTPTYSTAACGPNQCITVTITYDLQNHPVVPPAPGLGLVTPNTISSTAVVSTHEHDTELSTAVPPPASSWRRAWCHPGAGRRGHGAGDDRRRPGRHLGSVAQSARRNQKVADLAALDAVRSCQPPRCPRRRRARHEQLPDDCRLQRERGRGVKSSGACQACPAQARCVSR